MALSIARPKRRSLNNPSLIHLFSSSSSTAPPSNQFASQEADDSRSVSPQSSSRRQQQQQTSRSSYFFDIKASLKQQQNPQSQNQLNKTNFSPLRKPGDFNSPISKPASTIASLEEIRKNLREFRRRSSIPSPDDFNTSRPPYSNQQVSFQEIYKRSMIEKSEDGTGIAESSVNNNKNPIAGKSSFASIRESLNQMKSNASANRGRRSGDALSVSGFRGSLNLRPGNDGEPIKSTVIGGTAGLPLPMPGNEQGGMRTEFVKMYSYGELGTKLSSLRPEVMDGEKGWFSLEELNERLRKLRKMEEEESQSRIGVPFMELRESLNNLKKSEEDKNKKNAMQRLNILAQLGATPDFMMHPPKEHLVEKYFHPDNMSSAEKLKVELSKVREEFKMSESDCGSARVQVAQLTTKIKHLSSVLHKKDKHSRKGLQEMVQSRKKLLKYLRRTDWDSYCLVLSKLGLRDNPDFKHLTRN